MRRSDEELQRALSEFFRWWYNQPGQNTDEGAGAWLETPQGLAAAFAIAQAVREEDAEIIRTSFYTGDAQLKGKLAASILRGGEEGEG